MEIDKETEEFLNTIHELMQKDYSNKKITLLEALKDMFDVFILYA